MHRLYLEKHEPSIYSKMLNGHKVKPSVNYDFYLNIFNTQFNLSFGKPRSDTCSKCEQLKIQIESEKNPEKKVSYERERGVHHAKADKFYTDLKSITQTAQEDDTVEAICFDYQQNLPVPVLPVGEIFYKRQIWVFNQCFFSCKTGKSKMFMYDEATAKKGANETISFLKYYIDHFVHPAVKTLYLFSDNCIGQNKNTTMVQFLSSLAISGRFTTIYHRFPERGHSYLPCDRNFAVVEKQKRNVSYLYLPEEWYSLTAKCSKNFEVVRVNQDMVRDFRSFLTNFATKVVKNKNGHFSVTKYKSFKYSGNQITVSVTHNLESFSETFVAIRKNIPYPFQWTPDRLYNEPILINPLKLKNIKELSEYVPLRYQGWYESLQSHNENAAQEETEDSDDSDVN